MMDLNPDGDGLQSILEISEIPDDTQGYLDIKLRKVDGEVIVSIPSMIGADYEQLMYALGRINNVVDRRKAKQEQRIVGKLFLNGDGEILGFEIDDEFKTPTAQ